MLDIEVSTVNCAWVCGQGSTPTRGWYSIPLKQDAQLSPSPPRSFLLFPSVLPLCLKGEHRGLETYPRLPTLKHVTLSAQTTVYPSFTPSPTQQTAVFQRFTKTFEKRKLFPMSTGCHMSVLSNLPSAKMWLTAPPASGSRELAQNAGSWAPLAAPPLPASRAASLAGSCSAVLLLPGPLSSGFMP